MNGSRLLSREQYLACCADPMEDVTRHVEALVDIWPYVDAIDLDLLSIAKLNDVNYVMRDAKGRYDHVYIGTGRFNAMLVVVVDRRRRNVFGHWLLDLNKEYGVSGGHLRDVDGGAR